MPTAATFALRMFRWSNCVLSSDPLKMKADSLFCKSSSSLSGSCSSSILLPSCFCRCCSCCLCESSANALYLGTTTLMPSSYSTSYATYCSVLLACACLGHRPPRLSRPCLPGSPWAAGLRRPTPLALAAVACSCHQGSCRPFSVVRSCPWCSARAGSFPWHRPRTPRRPTPSRPLRPGSWR